MVFLKAPSSGASKLSVDILKQTVAAANVKRSEISRDGKTWDYRFRKWCTVHGVRATEDCVEQFFFCRPLANILRKVDESRFLHYSECSVYGIRNISFRGLSACLFVPMVLRAS